MKPKTGFFLTLCAVSSFLLFGAVAPKSEEDMMANATYVFTGTIENVYSRNKIVEDEAFGKYEHTYYISEVTVGTILKGDGLKKDDTAYLSSYKIKWLGQGATPPGHDGHYTTPEAGKSYKFYVENNGKNKLDIIFPNGMELIK
jgi:hypothetical protein